MLLIVVFITYALEAGFMFFYVGHKDEIMEPFLHAVILSKHHHHHHHHHQIPTELRYLYIPFP
jgi:hypothetical protein